MSLPHLLIVEDEHALAVALAAAVGQAGATSDLAPTASQARTLLDSGRSYDGMLLDIGLPDQNGLDFLASLKSEPRPPTVVISAHGEIQNTIAARKLGVIEFLAKPLDFDEFHRVLRQFLRPHKSSVKTGNSVGEAAPFIGAASTMRPVFQQIAHCCASEAPVLVRGDTGTGKSHAARLIKSNGLRSAQKAATLVAGPTTTTRELQEVLEAAVGGVLVLEEVAALTPEVQAELVRQFEERPEGEFPRLIATSQEDLRERVAEGEFRSDLFYRLQVLEVRLPPLRARMEDLPALVSFFIGQLAPERKLVVTPAALGRLQSHSWPGNLRELRNSLASALTVSTGVGAIEADHLPAYLGAEPNRSDEAVPLQLIQALDNWLDEELQVEESPTYRGLAERLEGVLVRRLLRRHDGKLARMASALQANRATLRKKLKLGVLGRTDAQGGQ